MIADAAIAPVTPADTIRSLRIRAVDVPLPKPHPTAGGVVRSAPLVLIDVRTDSGIVGRSYVFTYTRIALAATYRLVCDLRELIVGQPLAPITVFQTLQGRFRLLGAQGLTGIAAGGIDMALWDALARAHGAPLCRLLGGVPKPLAAYQSLGIASVEDGAREANDAMNAGFPGVKFKIGGSDEDADRDFVRAMRNAVGTDIDVMIDYNQSLGPAQGVRRGRALEEFQLTWIEEPCRADDDAGHAAVARAIDTPIVYGENWWAPYETARALAAGGCDEVMFDVMKIGGVTGWLEAAAVAAAHERRISSHLFPEFSAHLLAVSRGAHYLEWMDLASPILADALVPKNGRVVLDDRPGVGITWNEDAVARYLVHSSDAEDTIS